MAKIKQTYLADDNKEFATEAEADAHNQYLARAGNIEAFIQSAGLHKAQAGLARNMIPQYLAFHAANPDATAERPATKAAAEAAPAEAAAEAAPAEAAEA